MVHSLSPLNANATVTPEDLPPSLSHISKMGGVKCLSILSIAPLGLEDFTQMSPGRLTKWGKRRSLQVLRGVLRLG